MALQLIEDMDFTKWVSEIGCKSSAEQKLQMTCCDHPRNPRRKVWPSATWTASPLRRLAAETDEVDAPPIGPGWRWHS